MYADKITKTTDFYAVWIPFYTHQFIGNGGTWKYSPQPADIGRDIGETNFRKIAASQSIPKFDTEINYQEGPVNKGTFFLKPNAKHLAFKGWYLSPDNDNQPYEFGKPVSSSVKAYAHWSTVLRIDVLDKDGKPISNYKVKVTNLKDNSEVTGKIDDNGQWQSDSNKFYMGDKFKIEFIDLAKGMKAVNFQSPEIVGSKLTDNTETGTFTLEATENPTTAMNNAYYAEFKVVSDERRLVLHLIKMDQSVNPLQ